MDYYSLMKSVAFKMDAELAHNLAIKCLSHLSSPSALLFGKDLGTSKKYSLKVANSEWSFPVGLAAGLDKNAEAINFFARLLFGAVEVGTVTPLAQAGNEKPRLFRYPSEESIRNCMGFNNFGSDEVLKNIVAANRFGKVLGVNLGKNKITSESDAPLDYQVLYKKFAAVADYLVVNVSSPNTKGLRDLQTKAGLASIFDAISLEREQCYKPLFLKISPDLDYSQLDDILKIVQDYKLSGIIATNTTIMPERGAGGVSGKILTDRARQMRQEILQRLSGDTSVDVIGVGGISSFDELFEFWRLGGKVVQIYTSFIYQGPKILSDIKNSIDTLLSQHQIDNVEYLLKNIQHISNSIH